MAMHAAPLIAKWIHDNVPRLNLIGLDSAHWVAAMAKHAHERFEGALARRLDRLTWMMVETAGSSRLPKGAAVRPPKPV